MGTSTNGRYCGNQSPATMETGSNRLYVKFVSDGAGSAVGFRLTFREVHVQCGESIRLTHDVPQAYIMSPNYPAAYPHNVDCVWTILVPATETVQVEFDENFNIETHQKYVFFLFYSGVVKQRNTDLSSLVVFFSTNLNRMIVKYFFVTDSFAGILSIYLFAWCFQL